MPAMERVFGWNWRLRRVSRHNIVLAQRKFWIVAHVFAAFPLKPR
jgi:hypothetical protein